MGSPQRIHFIEHQNEGSFGKEWIANELPPELKRVLL
jgi:hypothetical protein